MTDDRLIYLPLGGAGEIGMNMYVYGYGRKGHERLIVVDAGVTFPDMDTTPGVKLVMADFDWLIQRDDQVEAIFLTHGHLDHVGCVPFLAEYFDAPIYAKPFSMKVVGGRLLEFGIETDQLNVVPDDEELITAGPFGVTYLPISHSIPESSALVIDTPKGRIIHSGDFKIDETPVIGNAFDSEALEEAAEVEVQALICDSTNALVEGAGRSEASIKSNIADLVTRCNGMVIATTFASHIARIFQLAEVAAHCGRSVLLLGHALQRMMDFAIETDLVQRLPNLVSLAQAKNLPRNSLMVIATGSQGEARAATAQLANGGSFKGIRVAKGDTVIYSSKTIPGNERSVGNIKNKFAALGVEIVDEPCNDYHVSGHPNQSDLEEIHSLLNPHLIVPMHGEYRHMVVHAEIAEANGFDAIVAPNGTMVDLLARKILPDESTELDKIYLDGSFLIGSRSGVVLNRLKMARNGVIAVSLLLKGNIIQKKGLRIQTVGLTDMGFKDFQLAMMNEIAHMTKIYPRKIQNNDSEARGKIEKITYRLARSVFDKKPQVIVQIFQAET